jgi:predicted kinase
MEMIVFCGIPASGKTTFYRETFFATHVRVSLDLLKTRQREDVLLKACFAARQPVVVDNTNVTAAQRKRYVEMAHAAGFKATLYFFDVSTRTAVGRNGAREKIARVPNVGIFTAQKKLQRPTRAEGFDAMYRVTSDGRDGAIGLMAPVPPFIVHEWNDSNRSRS